jgi:hypothetical protein
MGGNPDSDEFEEDEADEDVVDDDAELDRAIKDMEIAKRRSVRVGEPAWRRLERRLEHKRTAELISDFEDYDIGEPAPGSTTGTRAPAESKPRRGG